MGQEDDIWSIYSSKIQTSKSKVLTPLNVVHDIEDEPASIVSSKIQTSKSKVLTPLNVVHDIEDEPASIVSTAPGNGNKPAIVTPKGETHDASYTNNCCKIVENIKVFLNLAQHKSKGRRSAPLQHALDAIWCAASGDNISDQDLTKMLLSESAATKNSALKGYQLRALLMEEDVSIFDDINENKIRSDSVRTFARKAIFNWQHSDDVSEIESNSRVKPKTVCNII